MSSLPEKRPVERLVERPIESLVWLTELKAHLDKKFSSMESKLIADMISLEAKIEAGEQKINADLAKLESKIALHIGSLHN